MKRLMILLSLSTLLTSCAALEKRQKLEALQEKVQTCAVSVIPMLQMLRVEADVHQVIKYCMELHTQESEEKSQAIEIEAPHPEDNTFII